MRIPFFSAETMHAPLREEILEAMARVYDSGWYVLGEEVEAFEEAYARYNGVRHCIGVSNGLDALRLCLRALNLEPGSEVIVASNAYIACWNAVALEGLTVVPVEPDERTFNLDPGKIEAAITKQTRAIMPVHLFGQACVMPAIMDIAKRHDLHVIEDNAQSQGAEINGRKTGSFGHVNATSFYPTKNLGCLGDGGAITTDDPILAERIRILRNYGSDRKYHNPVIGPNNRLDALQATILRIKLNHLDDWNADRQKIADFYNAQFRDIDHLIIPEPGIGTHTWHIYAVRTPHRDALQLHLESHGIGTQVHYPIPPHLQGAYRHLGYKRGDFPLAERMAGTSLSLPIWPGVDAEAVAEAVLASGAF